MRLTLCFGLLLCLFGSSAHADNGLAARDWSIKAPHTVANYPPTKDEVEAFVNKVLETDWTVGLCSFAFADIAHDGKNRLIASLDGNGRQSCNEIAVIEKDGATIKVANRIKVWMIMDVGHALRDLDEDGRLELAVEEPWMPSEGAAHCHAVWGRVYRWQDGHFVDASLSYPALYRAREKELEAMIPLLADPSCAQMELDKISRFLGLAPKAGYDRALAWMKSDDGSLRRKAAAVFADIGDAGSKKNLSLLAQDNDPLVAESARGYMDTVHPKE